MKFRKYLEEHYVICDGAMGTYYESLYRTDEKPEFANEKNPERILSIHREYVKAGANLIRTNTFASNTKSLKISLAACECGSIREREHMGSLRFWTDFK